MTGNLFKIFLTVVHIPHSIQHEYMQNSQECLQNTHTLTCALAHTDILISIKVFTFARVNTCTISNVHVTVAQIMDVQATSVQVTDVHVIDDLHVTDLHVIDVHYMLPMYTGYSCTCYSCTGYRCTNYINTCYRFTCYR